MNYAWEVVLQAEKENRSRVGKRGFFRGDVSAGAGDGVFFL